MPQAMSRVWRGAAEALRSRGGLVAAVATGVFAVNLLLPPLLLSILRKPFDYFTFNAWLPELPRYLARGDVPWRTRLGFVSDLALFWFSADSPYGGVDWGFAVTVSDLLRMGLLSLLFGLYFALVFQRGVRLRTTGWNSKHGGVAGVLASVFGLSTGGCTVMGCGAPVIPVVGLAFVGLSSGALAFLAQLSRVATLAVFGAVTLAVLVLAWRAGGRVLDRAALPVAMVRE
jgi:hypothetical protein